MNEKEKKLTEAATVMDSLNLELSEVLPNIRRALQICISWLASVASCEHALSMLRQRKCYHPSTMGQEHLVGLIVLKIKLLLEN